jgi:lipopolysaccharide transport system permease protein
MTPTLRSHDINASTTKTFGQFVNSTILSIAGAWERRSPTKPASVTVPHIRLQPSKGWVSLKLNELWAYRELLYFLTWREVKVRYKQTVMGASWAIIQPFFTMVVFSLFFGKLAQIPSDGIPYPLFSFAALVPWTFFANGITNSGMSLVASHNLIKKVYFPRLVIPISSVTSGLIDFALAFVVLLGMMGYFAFLAPLSNVWTPSVVTAAFVQPAAQVAFTANLLFVLPLLGLAFITALGVGLWLSAMNVQFRDVRYIIPFLVQFWMFATPIAYPSSLLPEPWRTLFGLNPMAGVIEGFRWALLGTDTAPGPMIWVSAVMAILILISGAFYFRRMEKTFADVV